VSISTYCPHCGRDTETNSANVCVECWREKSKPATPSNFHPPKRSPDDYGREVAANDVGRGLGGCIGCLAPLGVLLVGTMTEVVRDLVEL
jgi:hypothetical protein